MNSTKSLFREHLCLIVHELTEIESRMIAFLLIIVLLKDGKQVLGGVCDTKIMRGKCHCKRSSAVCVVQTSYGFKWP